MKLLLINLLILISFNLFAQRDELMKELSLSACECIKEADENVGLEMKIGLCLLQSSSPRMQEIKDVMGIDLSDMNNFERLGEELAPTLVANCPEFMTMMMDAAADGTLDLDDEQESEESNEDTWSDMDSDASQGQPDYGGPENKKFITAPMENTNGSGLIKPVVKGKIISVKKGLSNEIVLEGPGKEKHTLYLVTPLENADKLKKGKTLVITYQEKSHFHAGSGKRIVVKMITKID